LERRDGDEVTQRQRDAIAITAHAARRLNPPDLPIIGAGQRPTARVSFFAASRRGLAFERAHFGSDPLDGGSPDANRRSGFVDARAAAQKPLNCPFRLGVDRRSRDPKATASMWKSLRKPVLSPGEALEDHRDFRPQRRK
jgi:hypothetical protein